jgi:hypothetical protein
MQSCVKRIAMRFSAFLYGRESRTHKAQNPPVATPNPPAARMRMSLVFIYAFETDNCPYEI